ncbi:MAG TPA: hypothetical protein VF584_24735 [Longimicrobium sp.]|jgi:hypothetical protein
MLVLVRYVDPHNAAWFNDLIPPPDPIRYIRVPLSSALHPVSYPGTSPLPATLRAEVLALLDGIAAARETESRTIWYAAASLAKDIRP